MTPIAPGRKRRYPSLQPTRWQVTLLVAILFTVSLAQALMRIYSNVPIASFPQPMKDAASGHFFNEGYLNVKSAPYNAKGDGVIDDSSAFLAAINDAYSNNLVVYVPSGTY